jgi:hypothetical protein
MINKFLRNFTTFNLTNTVDDMDNISVHIIKCRDKFSLNFSFTGHFYDKMVLLYLWYSGSLSKI